MGLSCSQQEPSATQLDVAAPQPPAPPGRGSAGRLLCTRRPALTQHTGGYRIAPACIPAASTDQGPGWARAPGRARALAIPRTPAAGRPSPPGTCWPLARRRLPRRPPRCETTAGTGQARQGAPAAPAAPRPPLRPLPPGPPAAPRRRLLTRGSQCLAPQGGPAPPPGPRCRLGAKRESSNCQPSSASIPRGAAPAARRQRAPCRAAAPGGPPRAAARGRPASGGHRVGGGAG